MLWVDLLNSFKDYLFLFVVLLDYNIFGKVLLHLEILNACFATRKALNKSPGPWYF